MKAIIHEKNFMFPTQYSITASNGEQVLTSKKKMEAYARDNNLTILTQ